MQSDGQSYRHAEYTNTHATHTHAYTLWQQANKHIYIHVCKKKVQVLHQPIGFVRVQCQFCSRLCLHFNMALSTLLCDFAVSSSFWFIKEWNLITFGWLDILFSLIIRDLHDKIWLFLSPIPLLQSLQIRSLKGMLDHQAMISCSKSSKNTTYVI